MMIDIESVSFRGFLSYGDYTNDVELSNIGPCLIRGANGAGKSTILNAILWCLFGRTMHAANPGNNVFHWFGAVPAWVQLKFKNGNTLTRIRTRQSKTEIIYAGDSDAIDTTLSTTGNEQQRLNLLLNLDWELFCGSIFLTQFGKPWMEMGDQTRKQAIERVLHIDRYSIYADLAKEKKKLSEREYEKLAAQCVAQNRLLTTAKGHLESLEETSANFDTNKKETHDNFIFQAKKSERDRDIIDRIDVKPLSRKWDIVALINEKLKDREAEVNSCQNKITKVNAEITSATRDIAAADKEVEYWKKEIGAICTNCKQIVPENHAQQQIDPYLEKAEAAKEALASLQLVKDDAESTKSGMHKIVGQVQEKLNECKPEMTVREAEAHNNNWTTLDEQATSYRDMAKVTLTEKDPNADVIQKAESDIKNLEDELAKLSKQQEGFDILIKHYNYIYRAYSDRRKIKSYVMADHLPYFNRRLHHYLDMFDLDIKIELNKSLGIDSNLWDYTYESGGERKRTDVAFTFAMFDLHEEIYGRQCNIIALDEVDGRLDDDGIEALVEVINTDLVHKAETILIISHKDSMHNTFPSEITVERNADRQSRVVEVR